MPTSFDLAGTEVGRYRVVSLLGRGGMGEVYDAIDPALGRHVALKVLEAEAGSDAKRLARFVLEARSASALNHPHLVSIYEVGVQANIHFIAMEKIDGSTLRTIFSAGRLPLKRTLELMPQITDAVAAAHGAGIVHRDLKPENIMVSRAGYAKVLDFGLAKLELETALSGAASASTLQRPTDSGTILGTVGYMSPEQAQGRPADERSDIFSLGCVLYEALAGRRAFSAATPIDTLHKLIHEDPPPLSGVSPVVPAEVQRIVGKAMAKDPEQRYQSAKEMTIDLRAAGRKTESPVRVDVAPARPRGRLLRWLAVAALLNVLVLALVFFPRAPAKPSLEIRRLTNSGDVINAVVSRDGKYMSYIRYEENGSSSIWLRQLATNQDLHLVTLPAAAGGGFWGQTFTPDGSAILYVVKRTSEPEGVLYRITTLGGSPEPLLHGIDSPVSFSPDGKRITWVRADFPKTGGSVLMVASSDGSGARVIATRRRPDYLAPIWYTGPAWSPRGTLIAAAVRRGTRARIIGVHPESGEETVIADAGWQHVGRVQWLPDGRGLLAIAGGASGTGVGSDRPIWFIPFPAGEPRQLTRDATDYRNLSVTADGKTLISVAMVPAIPELWRVPLDAADEPEILLTGGPFAGGAFSYLADGRIAVASRGGISTVSKTSDGPAQVTQLIHDRFTNRHPLPFAGGIAYHSSTPDSEEVCVTTLSGEGRTVIARGALMAMTNDGRRLVYARDGIVWMRTVPDGHERPLIGPDARNAIDSATVGEAAWSPAGDRIALVYGGPADRRLGVISAASGALEWSRPTNALSYWVRWTGDGSALLTSGFGEDRSNVWRIPFRGEPTKLTNFRDQIAWCIDISPNGKELALLRSRAQRDAVLITGFD